MKHRRAYPLPNVLIAKVHLQQMEARLVDLDGRLKRRPDDADLEQERVALGSEFDALMSAIEFTILIGSMIRCACGKLRHETHESAERQVLALALINTRRNVEQVEIYRCPEGVWHVATRGPRRRAA